MAQGYLWRPFFRTAPWNGNEENYDVKLCFTDVGGAVRIKLKQEVLRKERDDLNWEACSVIHGFRLQTTLTFWIINSDDQQFLWRIVNDMVNPEIPTYFSLDAQVNEHQIEFVDITGPTPLKDKTVVGSAWDLTVRSKNLFRGIFRLPGIYQDIPVADLLNTLPPASVFLRGVHAVLRGGFGEEDLEFVCLKTSAGSVPSTYAWIPTAAGG